jgi:staphylococcal nuclease domain-containing protein 1
VRDPSAREAITALAKFEEEARKAHRGMFVYGDPGDSDDEEQAPPRAWGKK